MSFVENMNQKRTELMTDILLPYLNQGDSVLDFGCGSMRLSRYISTKIKIDLTGIDIRDYDINDAKYVKYPGGKLPFKDNEFDVVLSIFVLHHTDKPEYYLEELARVSKKKIILCEDVYTNRFGKVLTKFIDWVTNAPYKREAGNNFKKVEEWKKLFKKNNLEITTLKRFYPHPVPLIPSNNVLMVVNK